MRSAVGLDGWTRPIRRYVEDRRDALELTSPVGQLLRKALPSEPLALPRREIYVLNRQRGKSHLAPFHVCPVELDDLAQDDPGRPAVGDDVVDGEEEDVVVLRESDQMGTNERRAGQVERRKRRLGDEPLRLLLAVGGRDQRRVQRLQRHVNGLVDDLCRLPVHLEEARPQALVPVDHCIEGEREGVDVQRSLEPEGQRDVVRATSRLQAVEEPEPLLRERQREREGLAFVRDDHLPFAHVVSPGRLPRAVARAEAA